MCHGCIFYIAYPATLIGRQLNVRKASAIQQSPLILIRILIVDFNINIHLNFQNINIHSYQLLIPSIHIRIKAWFSFSLRDKPKRAMDEVCMKGSVSDGECGGSGKGPVFRPSWSPWDVNERSRRSTGIGSSIHAVSVNPSDAPKSVTQAGVHIKTSSPPWEWAQVKTTVLRTVEKPCA